MESAVSGNAATAKPVILATAKHRVICFIHIVHMGIGIGRGYSAWVETDKEHHAIAAPRDAAAMPLWRPIRYPGDA